MTTYNDWIRARIINHRCGFGRLQAMHPWPSDSEIPNVEPFVWALDGGGRHLMDALIASRPGAILAEFGSFMGGSAIRFMEASPDLHCVLFDPWGDNLVAYVNGLIETPWAVEAYGVERLAAYGALLRRYGPMRIVRNNLASYRSRCVMIQESMPAGFKTLKDVGLAPDIIYLDAMKRRDEFWGAHEAFPDAIFTGDDWSWLNPSSGTFEVRDFVIEVARARSGAVYANRQTFVVSEPRHGLVLDDQFLYHHPAK